MARIYQSRALIDPSLYQLSGQLMNERIRQEHERRKMLSDAITAAGEGLGKTINSGIEEYKTRQDEAARKEYIDQVMADNEEFAKYQNNPFFKAGVNEFIRTGASSPLMSFLSSERTAQERSDTKKWHDAIRLGDAQNKYSEIFEKYKSEPSEVKKLKYKTMLQTLENQFGADKFGTPIEDYEKAQAIDDTSAALKAADKKREEDTSYSVKNWIRENILPLGSIKTKEDQVEIADFIRDSRGLTDSDRKELLDEVLGGKTLEEQHKKASQEAGIRHTGEKTGEALKDADNKKKAKAYVGQKLNSLQWNKVPEEQKAFLTRDASGKVSWRK